MKIGFLSLVRLAVWGVSWVWAVAINIVGFALCLTIAQDSLLLGKPPSDHDQWDAKTDGAVLTLHMP